MATNGITPEVSKEPAPAPEASAEGEVKPAAELEEPKPAARPPRVLPPRPMTAAQMAHEHAVVTAVMAHEIAIGGALAGQFGRLGGIEQMVLSGQLATYQRALQQQPGVGPPKPVGLNPLLGDLGVLGAPPGAEALLAAKVEAEGEPAAKRHAGDALQAALAGLPGGLPPGIGGIAGLPPQIAAGLPAGIGGVPGMPVPQVALAADAAAAVAAAQAGAAAATSEEESRKRTLES